MHTLEIPAFVIVDNVVLQPGNSTFHFLAVAAEGSDRVFFADPDPDQIVHEGNVFAKKVILMVAAEQDEVVSIILPKAFYCLKNFPGFRSAVKKVSKQNEHIRLRIRLQLPQYTFQLIITAVDIPDYDRSQNYEPVHPFYYSTMMISYLRRPSFFSSFFAGSRRPVFARRFLRRRLQRIRKALRG